MSGQGQNETLEYFISTSQVVSNETTSRSLSKLLSEGDHVTSRLLLAVQNQDKSCDEQRVSLVSKYLIPETPDMWSRDYIGLYSQYAAVGIVYGSSGSYYPLCSYVYKGQSNVCANAKNIIFFAWGFKLFFAIFTDTIRPFGLRRKPWMLIGWGAVLVIFIALALFAESMDVSTWLLVQLISQVFMMIADVPADGYCVELGQMESDEQRGQILATGQRVRFTFCIIAGFIQTFLLNGPTTNDSKCEISFSSCWSWGLTVNEYYGLVAAIIFVLYVPQIFLKEPDAACYPQHTVSGLCHELWVTMQNKTTFNLIVFVIGIGMLTGFTSAANILLEYYVIGLTNFQVQIICLADTILVPYLTIYFLCSGGNQYDFDIRGHGQRNLLVSKISNFQKLATHSVWRCFAQNDHWFALDFCLL